MSDFWEKYHKEAIEKRKEKDKLKKRKDLEVK